MLPPERVRALLSRYELVKWCILAQSSDEGWICIKEGDSLEFGETPLQNKVCPGNNKLQIKTTAEGYEVTLTREPCWEVPNRGGPFCARHFNTYYGRYIRYVYGSKGPEDRNPFFKLPALLYTIYYGRGSPLKVGTTIILKGFRRFLEQPHYLTSILLIGRNIVEVRQLEVELSKKSSMSQAPRVKSRVEGVVSSLRGDVAEGAERFACLLTSQLQEAFSKKGSELLKQLVNLVKQKGIAINEISTPESYAISESVILGSVKEANTLLGDKECAVGGLANGFLILKCRDKEVGIPYELIRDRSINLRKYRPS